MWFKAQEDCKRSQQNNKRQVSDLFRWIHIYKSTWISYTLLCSSLFGIWYSCSVIILFVSNLFGVGMKSYTIWNKKTSIIGQMVWIGFFFSSSYLFLIYLFLSFRHVGKVGTGFADSLTKHGVDRFSDLVAFTQ